MNIKWLYIAVGLAAVAAVIYPVAYSQFASQQALNNIYGCTPLIPCQVSSPGFEDCARSCVILMVNSTYYPGTVNASQGATITWLNRDGFPHTSTAFNDTWDSNPIPPGDSFTITIGSNFTTGQYYYHCDIHPQMVGLINVVKPSS